ncbi:hypothetical protein [Pedobacter panaciterrae]
MKENHTEELVNSNRSLDSLKITTQEQTRASSVIADSKIEAANDLNKTIMTNLTTLEKLSKQHKTTTKEFKSLDKEIQASKTDLRITLQDLDSIRRRLGKDSVNHEVEVTRFVTAKVYRELKSKQEETYLYIGLIAFLIGAFSWLFVVQLPQDELNKIQLKLARLELAKQMNANSKISSPDAKDA